MTFRRALVALISAVVIIVPSLHATPASAASPGEFVGSINSLRASKGLGALSVDGRLSGQAQRWAERMAGAGKISHNPNLSGTPGNWTKVGENVGTGGSAGSIFNALVNSSGHYRNMVNGSFNSIGVGVATGGDGRIYTAHVFAAFPGGGGGGSSSKPSSKKSSSGSSARKSQSSGSKARGGASTSKEASSPAPAQAAAPEAPPAPPAPVPSGRIVAGLNEVGSILTQG